MEKSHFGVNSTVANRRLKKGDFDMIITSIKQCFSALVPLKCHFLTSRE